MVGKGEFVDFLSTCTILRLEHGITQREIDTMVPYQYQMFVLMYLNHMKTKVNK